MSAAFEAETVRQLDGPTWHLADTFDDSLTRCGHVIHYGARRQPWRDTPEDERCHLCFQRLQADAASG